MEERLTLALTRIREIENEEGVMAYQPFFKVVSTFLLDLYELYSLNKGEESDGVVAALWKDGDYQGINDLLYKDAVPEGYDNSFLNPDYAYGVLGYAGPYLSAIYTEIKAAIPDAYEGYLEGILIRMELMLEVYSSLLVADGETEEINSIKDIFYWYVSDYYETEIPRLIKSQFEVENLAFNIVTKEDLNNPSYLYKYGERVTINEIRVSEFLSSLPEEDIDKMASTIVNGYRDGFIQAGKDLSKKKYANVRYHIGFERVIKAVIDKLSELGLEPVMYRGRRDIFAKRNLNPIGYVGANELLQLDYDHREDMGMILDGHLVNRRVECLKAAYEENKEAAALFAGPIVIETFGEPIVDLVSRENAISLNESQRKNNVDLSSQNAEITAKYIDPEQRSFSIIAFPMPSISENYEEIFKDTIKINTLDVNKYRKIQQTIIDVLDKHSVAHVVGNNGNITDLYVKLWELKDPSKETKFENCVADVNIPVGEVFTSPVLEGTHGVLNVKKVFLNEQEYKDLTLEIEDGYIKSYSCANFSDPAENRKYIDAGILFHHESLPMGEFAIGTNTTAYVMARKHDIEKYMPILIAEKTGPHFAFGDTCYSREEEVRVYNPDGKEIVAKENSASALRKTEPSKAYFNCHTDITIPYDELGLLEVIDEKGASVKIIENGRFVLEECEELNEAFLD